MSSQKSQVEEMNSRIDPEENPESASGRPNKYRKIVQQLRDAIAAGKYAEGERIPSETQLSRTSGASRLTVARALRELERDGIIERRAGSGTYVKDAPAVRGRMFGLLIPELGDTEIFEPICQGMARASRATHDELLWGAATRDVESHEQQALQLADYYINKDVAGVFFAPLEFTEHQQELNQRILEDFQRARIPVVLLDRDVFAYPKRSNCDLVGIDNRRAGHIITEHLIRQGAKRIVFFCWPNSAHTVKLRLAGYSEAVRQWGLPELSVTSDGEGLSTLLKEHLPDAFVCANDKTAGRLMLRLNELGVDIPGRVRVVGIDDAKYSSFLHVPLTTLRQPCHDIGAAAVWTMIERIEKPSLAARDVLLGCELIVRKSCGSMSA
jgi:DNA-binding LacI/PurR family transcriptional regulator